MEDRLSTLVLHSAYSGAPEDMRFDLQKLRDCTRLRSLELGCRVGDVNSMENPLQFPPNLVKLNIFNTRIMQRDLMQVLGELSKLKYLSLGSDAIGTSLDCRAGAVPQLQELVLWSLGIEVWRMEEGAMPRLTKIKIGYCGSLRRLPESIRFITTLKELEIKCMPREFCKRLIGHGGGSGEGEDSYIIQHIPSVIIVAED